MKKILLGLVSLLVSYQGIGAEIKHIDVFVATKQIENVTGCELNCQIHDIDATENILTQFFGTLPNKEEAYLFVMGKLKSPEWKEYEQQVVKSQQTIINAFDLGVEKYPAIVINEHSVVYGITDVNRAIRDYLNRVERDDEND